MQEWYCEGTVDGAPCNWDLSNVAIREHGWRPREVATVETVAAAERRAGAEAPAGGGAAGTQHVSTPRTPAGGDEHAATRDDAAVAVTADDGAGLHCVNGHPMHAGDLLCLVCGGDPSPTPSSAQASEPAARSTVSRADAAAIASTDAAAAGETQIDGWRLLRQIASTDGVRERYLARHRDTGRQAVLTLYRAGAEPDPSVYDVLRRLPREHVPEILATGRWDNRAYEVAEEMSGGTLADLGIALRDTATLHRVVDELGQALHAFSEVGLRHRDLRPGTLLVRSEQPLDLVISGFGSARLSEFDLDIVSPLETTRYMAPEAIAGGVAAASDWWSLGMVLLEQITEGRCFEGVHPRAFLIHVLANGVSLPDELDPSLNLLLRGLLARDRHQRWQWPQVHAWLAGEPVDAPSAAASDADSTEGAELSLGGRSYHKPTVAALAAAERDNWDEARDHLLRGVLATWAEQAGVAPQALAGLRQAAQLDGVDDDVRLMVALKLLNPEIPLILRGEIVTPGWLLQHPIDGYGLVSGPVPGFLQRLQTETWLSRLQARADEVRLRARNHGIELDEETLRIALLSTSRARLAAQWEARRTLLPDSDHPGLLSLAERRVISEEDLIILLSAATSQYRSVDEIVQQATALAEHEQVLAFDADTARQALALPRAELFRLVDQRIAGFARTGSPTIDGWAERFRLERRLPLHEVAVLLSVPAEQWLEPQKQQYVTQILDFFEKKVATAVLRGPLVRMTIGRTTGRIDLNELHGGRHTGTALLEHLLQRNARSVPIDPAVFDANGVLDGRFNTLYRQTTLYKRDTGIDGLYLGFPFLLYKDQRSTTRTRIAPVLLWPVELLMEPGTRGQAALAFDGEREEVRLNPALEGLLGAERLKAWRSAGDDVLGRSALKLADVMDAFGMLAAAEGRQLAALPPASLELPAGEMRLACAAVLFHVTFIGQAVGEDLRQLKMLSPAGTALEAMLRLTSNDAAQAIENGAPAERDRYLTVASDPSQEAAVFQARNGSGLVVEGPPGTGKSQTIVNMVADAIGNGKSLLIVCQKHAALEVVHKRLIAEGLGERIVMVNDINRDREPTIRAVREQLEMLFKGPPAEYDWSRQREQTAARIASLEGELDRQHEALHRVDPASGRSYRALLGELIALEAGAPPLDAPALRERLAALDIAALTTLEDQCAPLVRYWLPARFEGSALENLQAFATDRATLDAFHAAFAALLEAERLRADTLAAHPATFDLDDPEPARAWLSANAQRLLDLSDDARASLARWLPLFRPAAESRTVGDERCATLQVLHDALRQIDATAYHAALSPAMANLSDGEFETLAARIAWLAKPTTWLSALNPMTYIRRAQLRRFAEQAGSTGSDRSEQRFHQLQAVAHLEAQWRPRRAEWAAVRRALQLDAGGTLDGTALADAVRHDFERLKAVGGWARQLSLAPHSEAFDAAVLSGERGQVDALLHGFETAFVRQHVRERSLRALAALQDWLTPAFADACRRAVQDNAAAHPALAPITAALPALPAFQQFRLRAQRLDAEALQVFAMLRRHEAVLERVPPDDLDAAVRRLIRREARLGWKRRFEQTFPELLLDRSETTAKIAALAAADEAMRASNRDALRRGVARDKLGAPRSWEDLTRLTGRRARRLREFVELGTPLGLMALRPVWLMNPDVASRLLPLRSQLFDAVVYDEASQMPVEYAIPTLFRGRRAIVSGDEKQMPPTAFFSSQVDSDETGLFDGELPDDEASEEERAFFEETWNRREIKDCPDLLQLARTALPVSTLQIHYRSAYRELIAYSNAAFYENALSIPVRHPDATVRAVKPLEVIAVDGLYQQQTNADEAARVVAYLADLWRSPYGERPSVGVVTFNRKQADLIEEQLKLRAERDEAFRQAYREERERVEGGEDMAVFVKNVENVQGDERDIIVFSTTFGRNSQGAFRRFFGVLGQQGGERRLNVAVTRARKKVVLVTSMPIGLISDMLDTQRGPAIPRDYLQAYMAYARAMSDGELAGGRALLGRLGHASQQRERTELRGAATGDGFAAEVLAFLRSLGTEPVVTHEDDAFGLDFAIADPGTGLYALGIECDAPRHRLLTQARAREIWRPAVLKRAIGRLHRVSSQAWYHEPEIEKARLQAAVSAALGAEVVA
ncbi:AAA domain-containing protein [Chitinasiproducens palmae]|uniref:AAA domain-containing protein n=1 Tax=Chitinasiproducens palmae TaxID=1770053 RepID=UPI001F468CF9|nr:AAA domain-containing protein [Chitinasiproducens palmae]